MLILNEINHQLEGTEYTLPPELYEYYKKVILNFSEYSSYGGYRIARNVIENKGVISFDWFDNMRKFFNKHENEKDVDFVMGGSWGAKKYVNFMVKKLRISTDKIRKKHSNSATKPSTPSSNLTGNRGSKQSKSLSIMNGIMPSMASLIPKLESKENKKIFIITEKQLKQLSEYKWKPSASQRREFAQKMQNDKEFASDYHNRKEVASQKRRSTSKFDYNKAGGNYIPTKDQYGFAIVNVRNLNNVEDEQAFNDVIFGYTNNEKVHHDSIHIVNQYIRKEKIIN